MLKKNLIIMGVVLTMVILLGVLIYTDKVSVRDIFPRTLPGFIEKDKTYDPSEKRVVIKDLSKNKTLMDIRLTTPKVNKVGAGSDVKVAEFLLSDFTINNLSFFDEIETFNKKDNSSLKKTFRFKYGVDFLEEACETICFNTTETNWTEFNNLSEIPSKNIKIGLFTNTIYGENVEWIPTIRGFKITEWAAWDVTAGTKFEFDPADNTFNSLVKINDTHYINTYSGVDLDGFAVVLEVNLTDFTITNASALLEFDTNNGQYNSLVKINDTHYLNTYTELGNDGFAVVLEVNLSGDFSITNFTKFEFDATQGRHNSLVRINETHYLNTYRGNQGYAVVLEVNLSDFTVTRASSRFAFDNDDSRYNSLVKINDTHYINTYTAPGSDGFAVVLEVNLSGDLSITKLSSLEFDPVEALYNSLVKINDTHYLNTYAGNNSDGFAVVLEVNLSGDFSINNFTSFEFDTTQGQYNSLVKINETHHLNVYEGGGNDGFAVVLEVNQSDFTITKPSTRIEFDTSNGQHHSLLKINDTHYLNTYRGSGGDGFALVLTVEVPEAVADTCTYPGSGDWVVNCADNCDITSDVDVLGNDILITGTGTFNVSNADIINYNRLFVQGTDSNNICKVRTVGGGFKD